jgi:glutamyl/glutaminyl-tRNA synthetase
MNRHYMKEAAPTRLAAESMRYFLARGYVKRRTDESLEYVASILPLAVGSVDRLEEIPERVRFIFEFDAAAAMTRDEVTRELREPAARSVIDALAREIEAPLLDKETFRAMAARVRSATGQKGKALFHPIRVALTGETAGPELDLAVPAIDRGAVLCPPAGVIRVLSTRERAAAFARAVAE